MFLVDLIRHCSCENRVGSDSGTVIVAQWHIFEGDVVHDVAGYAVN